MIIAQPLIHEARRHRMRVGPLTIARRRVLLADTHGDLRSSESRVLRRLCAWSDGSVQMELVTATMTGCQVDPSRIVEVQVTVTLNPDTAERGALWMAIVLGLVRPGDAAVQAWIGAAIDALRGPAPCSPVAWFGEVAASLRMAAPFVTLVLTDRGR